MNLQKWLEDYGHGAIAELHHRSRVNTKTISEAAKDGARTRRIAERISEATRGAVTVASLLGIETPAPDTTAGA